jgi:hypothetical protein
MALAQTLVVKHGTWDFEFEGCLEAAARQRRCGSDFDVAYGSYMASPKADLDDSSSVSTACVSGRARSLSGSSWEELSSTVDTPKSEPQRTTLMLRNLPRSYTRSSLQRLLDIEGFAGRYCFVYAPGDFQTLAASGFAFVCFCEHDAAAQAKRHFQGFSRWGVPCQKKCNVAWSGAVQGLEQHTERYRNSSVMHPLVPDELKPAVFVAGIRVPFPEPTREIPPPTLRGNVSGHAANRR